MLGGFAVVNVVRHDDGHPLLRILWAKEARDPEHDYERWNAFSRLTVDGDPRATPTAPLARAWSSTAPPAPSSAATSGDPTETDFLRDQITNLAHYIRHDADVLVVGSAAAATSSRRSSSTQRSVTGVEINGDILDITNDVYGDFTGHLDRNPTVDHRQRRGPQLPRPHRPEVRHHPDLADRHVGGHVGRRLRAQRELALHDRGVGPVPRPARAGRRPVGHALLPDVDPAATEPLETYRTVALAAQVLDRPRRREPPRPHPHLRAPPDPPSASSLANDARQPRAVHRRPIAATAERGGAPRLHPVLTPDDADRRPTSPSARRARRPRAGARRRVDEDISPPTDNRPFFFQMADLDTFLDGERLRATTSSTRPVLVLGVLAVAVLALAVGVHRPAAARCVARPRAPRAPPGDAAVLHVLRRHRPRLPADRGLAAPAAQHLPRPPDLRAHGRAVLGAAVQRHREHAHRAVRADRRPSAASSPRWSCCSAVVRRVRLRHAGDPPSDGRRDHARRASPPRSPCSRRSASSWACRSSIGMRAAAARPGTPTAFLWGINGATSVCASVLGVVIALFFGIAAAFWTGGARLRRWPSLSMVVITARAVRRDDGGSGRLDAWSSSELPTDRAAGRGSQTVES